MTFLLKFSVEKYQSFCNTHSNSFVVNWLYSNASNWMWALTWLFHVYVHIWTFCMNFLNHLKSNKTINDADSHLSNYYAWDTVNSLYFVGHKLVWISWVSWITNINILILCAMVHETRKYKCSRKMYFRKKQTHFHAQDIWCFNSRWISVK